MSAYIFQVFTAGYTNVLIGCSLRGDDSNDVVLVRVYGRGTNLMINRQQERNSMVVLHTVDCAAPVYCRFKNGIAYGYKPGFAIDCNLVKQSNVRRYYLVFHCLFVLG
jgi:ethanolamine kinase